VSGPESAVAGIMRLIFTLVEAPDENKIVSID
jgi:hypothetical protein